MTKSPFTALAKAPRKVAAPLSAVLVTVNVAAPAICIPIRASRRIVLRVFIRTEFGDQWILLSADKRTSLQQRIQAKVCECHSSLFVSICSRFCSLNLDRADVCAVAAGRILDPGIINGAEEAEAALVGV